MNFRKLTFLASLILTLAIVLVVFIFDASKENLQENKKEFYYTIGISLLMLLVINYFVLEMLLKFYGKKQIKRITTILPHNLISENTEGLSFTQLGERFSELSQKSATEIDTMKEMETYRKEYIGNISHELKTPLFSIQGYVETLMEGGVDDLSIRDKYLERIDKSVERLLNIVKDLDMINRFESGEITLNISEFDINLMIREVIDLFDLDAQRKNTKITLQNNQNQYLVRADKQKISQVLINLISNAIHYSNRENAQIIVKTSSLRNKIFIEVSDNGMGIKPEVLPRIFERFYRVESSRSRKDGGSGLGLAIVKHILEAHNEMINVNSIYLEGTTFSFMLEKA